MRRHSIPPAPQGKKTTTWKEFIRSHMDVLAATDFFTAEVWTQGAVETYYVLFFIHLASRGVHIAGITPHPNEPWMIQVARNVTMADVGFLPSSRVKEECLSKLILFGERSLRNALKEYLEHHYRERNHQGKDNRLLFPANEPSHHSKDMVRDREWLGGLPRFYHREAA